MGNRPPGILPISILQTVHFTTAHSKTYVWYADMQPSAADPGTPCHLSVTPTHGRASRLTWWIALNHWMVVHLESGIATAACEAYNMVLAVIYCDGRLIDGDVICPHVEDNSYFSFIL